MKSIITTTRNFSNSNSQESIIVYLPNSTYSPSLKEDEKNSDCCDSVLICQDFDVETEKDHVKGDNDDDVFKLLSMNFYSSRDEPKRFEDDRTLKSARSNRENALAGKTNSLASIKAKNNRSKKNLYHHFFDSDKIKKKPPLLSPKKVKQDDVGVGAKKKGKKCKMSYLENLKTDMDLPYNPLGSNKTKKSIENIFSPSKKVEPLVKYYSSFLVKKEGCGRNTNNVSKLASSDVRYSSLTRTKDAKNASTTVLAKRKSPVLKKVKNQKMLTCGNESVSPRSKEEGRDSQDALGIKKFPLTLRDQLFNTFSEMVPKAKKGFNLTLPGRNESSTASATSFGGKSSFFNTLESKRTTRDQISCSLGVKEGNMNKEAIMNRNKGSRQSQNSESSKASTSSKRLALQKVSEELPKKKSVVNKQEHVRNTGPYLFFDMPSLKIESNPTLKGVKEIKEMKEKGKAKDLAAKKLKAPELGERKKKESEETGNAGVKSKDNEYTSYRDSFLSLRS